MALDNTSNTTTTDRAPEHQADDELNVEEAREPSTEPAGSGSPEPERTATDAVTGHPVTEGPVAEEPPTGDSGSEGNDDPAGTADGFVAGAAAVVSAGLGLSSLTGTGVGDMLRARAEIVGQIQASTGGAGIDQVEAFYGAPWDTAALVNGAVALVAVVIGGVLLAASSGRPIAREWVRAVAFGGVVLGGIGLFVAAGMYLDLFAAAPELPRMPQLGG